MHWQLFWEEAGNKFFLMAYSHDSTHSSVSATIVLNEREARLMAAEMARLMEERPETREMIAADIEEEIVF